MKYSFKEKQNHFRALRAEQHALADLALLEQKAPALPQLRKFKLLPVRYADEILYALLDVCSREQVVSHRRTTMAEAEAAASQALAESAAEEEAAAEAAIEAKEELEALQAEHEELQSEHEDLQSEQQELESQMQELEETNEQLQEELKEEKKKEPAKAKAAPKPKKKSTPK